MSCTRGCVYKDEFVDDFVNYARVVSKMLSPKLSIGLLFNEPWCSSILGYNTGLFAPGCYRDRSKSVGLDSSRDPWIVGHNLLVAHGVAVKIYREEFKTIGGGGEIGITLNGEFDFFYRTVVSGKHLSVYQN